VKDAIGEVCDGRVDGAFLEENSALATLLDGLPCVGIPVRLIWAPSIRTNLGVAATFEAARVADEIREEIGTIAKEGQLSSMASRWGDFSVRNTETIHSLQDARRSILRGHHRVPVYCWWRCGRRFAADARRTGCRRNDLRQMGKSSG
jgi:hypothetical protein